MSAAEEIRTAAQAAAERRRPKTITASFDTAGRTMMGVAPAALGALVEGFDPKPSAMGRTAASARPVFRRDPRHERGQSGRPLIAKATPACPRMVASNEIQLFRPPELMQAYAGLAAVAARIIGGCRATNQPCGGDAACGSTSHIAGPRPGALEAIVAALGPTCGACREETGGRSRPPERV